MLIQQVHAEDIFRPGSPLDEVAEEGTCPAADFQDSRRAQVVEGLLPEQVQNMPFPLLKDDRKAGIEPRMAYIHSLLRIESADALFFGPEFVPDWAHHDGTAKGKISKNQGSKAHAARTTGEQFLSEQRASYHRMKGSARLPRAGGQAIHIRHTKFPLRCRSEVALMRRRMQRRFRAPPAHYRTSRNCEQRMPTKSASRCPSRPLDAHEV